MVTIMNLKKVFMLKLNKTARSNCLFKQFNPLTGCWDKRPTSRHWGFGEFANPNSK